MFRDTLLRVAEGHDSVDRVRGEGRGDVGNRVGLEAPEVDTIADPSGNAAGAAALENIIASLSRSPAAAALDDTIASDIDAASAALGNTATPGDGSDRALADTASLPRGLEADGARLRAQLGPPGLGPGATIGRLRILRTLGAGGMGVVYAAYDPKLDREVAVKLIGGDDKSDAARLRLEREAQALAKLAHPNIVSVFDVGVHEGQVWVSMELILGRTLSAWIAQERPGWRQALSVVTQAGRGIAAAHAEGMLHRDVKPDNIMVGDDGRVRVMDFGLARTKGAREEHHDHIRENPSALSVELTAVGAIMGTPAYMAPEQLLGLRADERTDEFSLAVTLWEALYGSRPFAGDDFAALRVAVTLGERAPAPTDSSVPLWLRRILDRALKVDRNKRFESVRVMLEAIEDQLRWARTRLAVLGLSVGNAELAAEKLAIEREKTDEHVHFV